MRANGPPELLRILRPPRSPRGVRDEAAADRRRRHRGPDVQEGPRRARPRRARLHHRPAAGRHDDPARDARGDAAVRLAHLPGDALRPLPDDLEPSLAPLPEVGRGAGARSRRRHPDLAGQPGGVRGDRLDAVLAPPLRRRRDRAVGPLRRRRVRRVLREPQAQDRGASARDEARGDPLRVEEQRQPRPHPGDLGRRSLGDRRRAVPRTVAARRVPAQAAPELQRAPRPRFLRAPLHGRDRPLRLRHEPQAHRLRRLARGRVHARPA